MRDYCRSLGLALVLLVGGLAVPASGQGSLGRKHDTNLPIEISADNLEVQQDRQVAIFTGNVDALQGEIRLKADTLQVHYRQGGGGTSPAPQRRTGTSPQPGPQPGAAASRPGEGNSIRQINAIGHVFVSSPDETARGDRGVYDVEKRVIVLEGDVVLTQGQNVLKGQRATMNLDTGRSVMETVPGGRVRGLFVPGQGQGQGQNQGQGGRRP